MKLKITRTPGIESPRVMVLTTPCPFGEEAKVGSISCLRCAFNKGGYTKEFIFCRRGDKPRKRKQEAEE